MRALARVGSIVIATALTACAAWRSDAPAVISNPNAATRAELTRVVSGALEVPTVTIADDALTRESVLVIERTPARDVTGQRLSGRDFERPERFTLIKRGSHCSLIHERTGERYQLRLAHCRETR